MAARVILLLEGKDNTKLHMLRASSVGVHKYWDLQVEGGLKG